MKRFSILCCLVLLMNLLCPIGLAHADDIATPTDLCEHTYYCGKYNGTCEECGASVAEEDMVVEHWIEQDTECLYDDNNHWYICGGCNQPAFVTAHSTMDERPYEKDAQHHWKSCVNEECGYVFPKEEHSASCTNPGVCLYCGYEGEIENIVMHDNAIAEKTAAGHIWACKNCGERSENEKHFASCNEPGVCLLCGYEGAGMEISHHYESFINRFEGHDENNHWSTCLNCGKITEPHNWKVSKTAAADPATCTEDGSQTYSCWLCQATKVETLPATNHSYSWVAAGDKHQYVCANCGDVSAQEAHFNSCTDTDLTHCDLCGYEGSISQVRHGESQCGNETDESGNDWCVASCPDCGQETLRQAHTFTSGHGMWINATEHRLVCSTCDYQTSEKHDPKGDYSNINWSKDSDGNHYGMCRICYYLVYEGQHTASCTTPGVCATCGYKDDKLTAEHTWGNWADGDACVYGCTVCKYEENRGEHMAYCTHPEYCAYCGEVGDWDYDHNWDFYSEGCAISDGAEGHHYVCQDCDAIEKADHMADCNNPTHCAECGYEGTIDNLSHHTDGKFSFDESMHWSVCNTCGKVDYSFYHYAFCDDPTYCYECGHEGNMSWLEHYQGEWVSFGEEGCGYICTKCGHKKVQEHVSNCDNLNHCTLCDYKGSITWVSHDWDEWVSFGKDGCGYICTKCDHKYVQDHYVDCADTTHCSNCGDKVTPGEAILWHPAGRWISDGAAGCHYSCSDCGYTGITETHAAYCDDSTKCHNCGYKGSIGRIWHYNGDWVSFGAENHGYICEKCGAKEESVHCFYCDDPTHCVSCDYEGEIDPENVVHVKPESVYLDADSCYFSCTDCGYKGKATPHVSDCSSNPTECVYCGYKGQIDKLTHVCDDGIKGSDETSHWFTCTMCKKDITEKHYGSCKDATSTCSLCKKTYTTQHTWGDPVIVEATAGKDGSKTYTCTVCGETKVETIPATGTPEPTATPALTYEPDETATPAPTVTSKPAAKPKATPALIPLPEETEAVHTHVWGACTSAGNGTHSQTCADCGEVTTANCTMADAKIGTLDASACIYCGHITWKQVAADATAQEGKQESKPVENATFTLLVPQEETADPAVQPEARNITLVVYEAQPETTIELDTGAKVAVKKALTIALLEDNAPITLTSAVKLNIPVVEEEMTGLKLLVMDENGELVEIEYEIIDGVMVFETEILGIFLLVEEEA